MKVVIIIPFFGRFPLWMEYFLLSCGANHSYRWIIISDAPEPEDLPENVSFEACSLSEFNTLASTALDLDIQVRNPYKICDLRPAFGNIFKELLKDADFWGYSDLDLVFGNIGTFLNHDVFNNYDLISSRKEYLAGHFALYRNNARLNNLYQLSPIHKEIFENGSRHFAFDERSNIYGRSLLVSSKKNINRNFGSGIEYLWHKLKYKMGTGIPGELPDMNSIVKKVESDGEIKVFRKDLVRSDKWYRNHGQRDWQVNWENGRLFDAASSDEFLHFHFLEGKNQPAFKISPIGSSAAFSISPSGIKPVSGQKAEGVDS